MMEDRRATFISGLRQAADFFQQHPNLEMPSGIEFNVSLGSKESLIYHAKAMGKSEKVMLGEFYILRKDFGGGVKLDVFTSREAVCTRKVVGQWLVPAQPEHLQDIVEWECEEPLLAEEKTS